MQNAWVPELGKLIIRQSLCLSCNGLQLAFRDEANDVSHVQSIAEANDFSAKARFCGWVECIDGESGVTGAGMMVVRRLATDNDIKIFLLFWSDRSTALSEWLDEVKNTPVLADDEKTRIQRLAVETGKIA